ncbi:hypothetical protein E2C01_010060 [Portunus trituberculatus]|uniref:Uncharacterized protein n=1 Tax=Portunus trituberculatus TaxID=210409 RepID=A0A5B7D7D2_PORTR|nr:hypothetical protein [Portunus trituberculatus]
MLCLSDQKRAVVHNSKSLLERIKGKVMGHVLQVCISSVLTLASLASEPVTPVCESGVQWITGHTNRSPTKHQLAIIFPTKEFLRSKNHLAQ